MQCITRKMRYCNYFQSRKSLKNVDHSFRISQNNTFHSSSHLNFPLSDYDVFWLRQPRKWDFILFGNHPPMFPNQNVRKLQSKDLYAKLIPSSEKKRMKSDDTFNRPWEIPPWAHDRPGRKIPCTLSTKQGIIDFEIERRMADRIGNNLRARCIKYNLYVRNSKKLALTPHQLIIESWQKFSTLKSNEWKGMHTDNENIINADMILMNDSSIDRDSIAYNLGLATKFVSSCEVFLKQIKRRFIFDEVESLHFEEYIAGQPMNIVIPCRFYGLDQWFPMPAFQQWMDFEWSERPRYVQHEFEIEFQWNDGLNDEQMISDGGYDNMNDINIIPQHLSITVEQFCLPWKTKITLNDIRIPEYLKPMKDPSDITILSLNLDRMQAKALKLLEESERESVSSTVVGKKSKKIAKKKK